MCVCVGVDVEEQKSFVLGVWRENTRCRVGHEGKGEGKTRNKKKKKNYLMEGGEGGREE